MSGFVRVPITRRVWIALAVLAVAIATQAWHKNVVSSVAIIIVSIALAVWLGGELSKGESVGGQ